MFQFVTKLFCLLQGVFRQQWSKQRSMVQPTELKRWLLIDPPENF